MSISQYIPSSAVDLGKYTRHSVMASNNPQQSFTSQGSGVPAFTILDVSGEGFLDYLLVFPGDTNLQLMVTVDGQNLGVPFDGLKRSGGADSAYITNYWMDSVQSLYSPGIPVWGLDGGLMHFKSRLTISFCSYAAAGGTQTANGYFIEYYV